MTEAPRASPAVAETPPASSSTPIVRSMSMQRDKDPPGCESAHSSGARRALFPDLHDFTRVWDAEEARPLLSQEPRAEPVEESWQKQYSGPYLRMGCWMLALLAAHTLQRVMCKFGYPSDCINQLDAVEAFNDVNNMFLFGLVLGGFVGLPRASRFQWLFSRGRWYFWAIFFGTAPVYTLISEVRVLQHDFADFRRWGLAFTTIIVTGVVLFLVTLFLHLRYAARRGLISLAGYCVPRFAMLVYYGLSLSILGHQHFVRLHLHHLYIGWNLALWADFNEFWSAVCLALGCGIFVQPICGIEGLFGVSDSMGEQLNNELTRRSLWLGDLASWMDEGFLFNLFLNTRQLMSVKLIRNRSSGQSEGYAFLEFSSPEAAANVLALFNGQVIPGTDQIFRLNWAAYGVGKTASAGEDHSLFVGDLAPDVSDLILQEYFRQFYPSVRSAKVITDTNTGRSKGYGFVRFSLESERDRALTDMSGQYLSNRPIRVSLATARKNAGSSGGAQASQVPHPSDFDTTNTTLFIGGLSAGVSEEQLRSQFARFGDIIYVKIPQGKGCGFVQFVLRASAERALAALNGQVMGGSAIRISWGRSSSRATSQSAAQGMGMGGGQGAGGALVGGAALVGGGGPGLAFGMAPPGSLGMAPPGHHAPGASFGPFDPALLAAQGYASFAHAGAAGMGAGPGSSVHEAYAVGGPQGAAFGPGGMRSAHGADLYHAFQPAVGVGAVSRGGSGLDVGDGSGSGRHEGGGANGFGSGPFGSLVPGGSSLAPPQGGPGSEEGGPGSAPAALASAKSAGSVGSRGEAGDGSGGGAQVAGAGDAEADTISAAFGIKGAGSDAGAATPPAASPTGAGAGGPPNGSVSAASSNLIGSHLFANFLA